MARVVELKWKCGECGTDGILGRHKRCPSCGSPREKGEMKMDGLGKGSYGADGRNRAATVTDPELLKLAKAGADWFCSHCGSGNVGNGDRCSACGAQRYGEAAEDHPDFQGDHQKVTPPDEEVTPECAPPRDVRGKKGGEEIRVALSDTPKTPRASRPPPAEPSAGRVPSRVPAKVLVVVGGVAAVALVGGFIFWAFQTHEVTGSVSGMAWERTVHVERWTDTTTRLWRHQTSERAEVPPRGGAGERAGIALVVGSCRSEHFDDERYVCGSHEVCEDVYRTETEEYSCSRSESYACGETCSDNGNGFATCRDQYCTRSVPDTCTRSVRVFDHKACHNEPDYCTRPIMKDKCDYATQEWRAAGTYPTSGKGTEFSWGEEPQGDEIRRFYSATYTVDVAFTDRGEADHHGIESSVSRASKADAERAAGGYLTWKVGDPVLLEVNNLGGVHDARHATPEKP